MHAAHSEPPEGVVAGENVPRGSEPDEYQRELIERTMHALKARGPPFTSMSASELEEKALEYLRLNGVDL